MEGISLRAILDVPTMLLFKATINFVTGHLEYPLINTKFPLVMQQLQLILPVGTTTTKLFFTSPMENISSLHQHDTTLQHILA